MFQTLKLKQIMTSVIAITDLGKTAPIYLIFIIYTLYTYHIYRILTELSMQWRKYSYLKSQFLYSMLLFVWTTISNIWLRKPLTYRYNKNKLVKTLLFLSILKQYSSCWDGFYKILWHSNKMCSISADIKKHTIQKS